MSLAQELERVKPRLKAIAPPWCDVEEVIANLLWAVGRDDDLSRCSPRSVVQAAMEALAVGLDPSGLTGDGTLIPRKTKTGGYRATFVPDYRALLKLALAHPRVSHIESRVVRSGDEFQLEFGDPDGRILRHRPAQGTEEGDPVGAYAAAWFLDDRRPLVEWMTKAEIDANAERGGSFGSDSSPWETDWAEMARKTVIKRLLKYLPLADRRPVNQSATRPKGDLYGNEARATPPEFAAGEGEVSAAERCVERYREMIRKAGKADIPTIAAALRSDDGLDSAERSEMFQLLNLRQEELKGNRTNSQSRDHAEVG